MAPALSGHSLQTWSWVWKQANLKVSRKKKRKKLRQSGNESSSASVIICVCSGKECTVSGMSGECKTTAMPCPFLPSSPPFAFSFIIPPWDFSQKQHLHQQCHYRRADLFLHPFLLHLFFFCGNPIPPFTYFLLPLWHIHTYPLMHASQNSN